MFRRCIFGVVLLDTVHVVARSRGSDTTDTSLTSDDSSMHHLMPTTGEHKSN
jgi:hypothetical protein